MKKVFLLAMPLAGLGCFKAKGQNAHSSKVVRNPYGNGIWYSRYNISAFHYKHPKNMIEIVPDTTDWAIVKQMRHPITQCEAYEINHTHDYPKPPLDSYLDLHTKKDCVPYIMMSVHDDGEAPTFSSCINEKELVVPGEKGSIETMDKEEFFKKFKYDDCHKKKTAKKQGNSLSK